MSVYLVGSFEIHDFETYQRYIQASHPIMEEYGAKVLAAGQALAVKEGSPAAITVIVEFESLERANSYYHSEAYQRAAQLRKKASTGWLQIVGR